MLGKSFPVGSGKVFFINYSGRRSRRRSEIGSYKQWKVIGSDCGAYVAIGVDVAEEWLSKNDMVHNRSTVVRYEGRGSVVNSADRKCYKVVGEINAVLVAGGIAEHGVAGVKIPK